jgi:hypothetical protein
LYFASTREEKTASERKRKSAREKLREATFLSSEYEVENMQSSCLTLPGSLNESNRENAALSPKCKDLTEEISVVKSGVLRALEEMDAICGRRDAMSHEPEHSNSMDCEELYKRIEALDDQLQNTIGDIVLLATGQQSQSCVAHYAQFQENEANKDEAAPDNSSQTDESGSDQQSSITSPGRKGRDRRWKFQ